jgi:chromosome partitioning protein
MPAKVITLLNEKGGVGKTTTVTAIACLLARDGNNVCIIDTDTQGHVASRLNRKREDGFFALMDGHSWRDVLRPLTPDYYGGKTEQPLLWIVPSAAATRNLDNSLNAHLLIKRLQEIRSAFDFVFFDTSPKLGAIHAALFAASDYILIPTECNRLSVEGVVSTTRHIENAEDAAHKAGLSVGRVLGIIPTKFNGTKSVHHQNYGWLAGKYSDQMIFPAIRFLTDWEKAEAKRMPIHLYSPRSAATADTRVLVNHMLEAIEADNAQK